MPAQPPMSLAYVYATDSHTETSIKDFLVKINPDVHWVVRSPLLPKKPKKDYAARATGAQFTGRTGRDLTAFLAGELSRHPGMLTRCHAIVLEDDIDMRDAGMASRDFLEQETKRLSHLFRSIDANYTAKIICLFAAPEIETWFAADWRNGFGSLGLDHKLATALRRKISNDLMPSCKDNLESYSTHFTEKLSVWIETALSDLALLYCVTDMTKASYSKRRHGPKLLSRIDPGKVAQTCSIYFAPAYRQIQNIP